MMVRCKAVVTMCIFVGFVAVGVVSADLPSTIIDPSSGYRYEPDIHGDIVVWQDSTWPQRNIRGFDLTSSQPIDISPSLVGQWRPAIHGSIVVWEDERDGNFDIYGNDISGSLGEFVICDQAERQWVADVSGSYVVWQDHRNGNNDIYGLDLSTMQPMPICVDAAFQSSPAISGNIVVWEDQRNNGDIYAYDLSTQQEFTVSTAAGQQCQVAIDGSIVVWVDYRTSGPGVYGYDLDYYDPVTGIADPEGEFVVSLDAVHARYPAVSGNIVVWEEERNGNRDIYGYDMARGTEFAVATTANREECPAVSGDIIVWSDGLGAIRMAVVPEPAGLALLAFGGVAAFRKRRIEG